MSKGETARLEIDPEWAYGKKGVPESKYPFFPPLFGILYPACMFHKYLNISKGM